MNGATLQVFRRVSRLLCGPEILPFFQSNGKWLHPLFELEDYLNTVDVDTSTLILRDKIIGKAAAFMILRMGITDIRAEIASLPAVKLFEAHGLRLDSDEVVDRIDCMTEGLLESVNDQRRAYELLCMRRESALAH